LQANVNGQTIDLVRYTNAKQCAVGRVAKYLEDIAAYNQARVEGQAIAESPICRIVRLSSAALPAG
jgi:hypothetical protein